jgi:hypothetical protein
MKQYIIIALCILSANGLFAQERQSKFFKKENIFTGGTLNAGFGYQSTTLGITPSLGYSVNKFIEIAFCPSINYISQRDYQEVGDKLRITSYGPGAFLRILPVNFLFAQAQYEYNISKFHYIPVIGSNYINQKLKIDAHSLLIGGGYASGRDFPSQKTYYYFSVMWDVGHSINSPYKDNLHRSVPIFRAGYNIALFQ